MDEFLDEEAEMTVVYSVTRKRKYGAMSILFLSKVLT